MFINSPAGAVLCWLLFSLVLIWALWDGFPEFAHWLKHNYGGSDDIQFFPDEVRGEPGPGTPVAPRGEVGPPGGAAGARRQAR
jgi:hypothetical protein